MGGAQHACMQLSKAASSIIIAANILWSHDYRYNEVSLYDR